MNKRLVFNAALLVAFLSVSGCGGGGGSAPGDQPVGTDVTPDAFTLEDIKDAKPGEFYTASMTIGGVDAPVKARVCCSGSSSIEFSIDGGKTFGTKPVDVENGDKIIVRLKAKAEASGIDNGSLFVGGTSASPDAEGTVEDNFQVVTKADVEAPKLSVHFPPPFSLATGETEIRVRGGVTDESGIESLTVAGVEVEIDKASGAWSAVVPLVAGPNAIEITAKDRSGEEANTTLSIDTTAATIGSGESEFAARSMIYDHVSNMLFATRFPDKVMSLNVATGERRMVTSATVGAGTTLREANDILMSKDRETLLVTDGAQHAVVAVKIASGDREPVSDNTGSGVGPDLAGPYGLAFASDTGRFFVLQNDSNRLYELDLATGERNDLAAVPGGSTDITANSSGSHVFATEHLIGDILRIDTADGTAVSIVNGDGPELDIPGSLFLSRDDVLYFRDGGTEVLIKIDLNSNARALVSGAGVGSGPAFPAISAFAMDEHTLVGFVGTVSFGTPVFAVDLTNGDRVIISKE